MKIRLDNKVYDVLKWTCLIALPAAGTLYLAVAGVWGLPRAAEAASTISAVETFLGAILGVSSVQRGREEDGGE